MNISTRSVLIDHRFLLAIIVVLVITLANYDKWTGPTAPVYSKSVSPTVVEEFRAAWIASVANINWPSEMGLSVDEQQQQAINLLDAISAANMNAVILQIRPQADALYDSPYEPWSYYLTGTQGTPPEPFYDPLAFWVEQAHLRGLELHAWINPYRAHHMDGGPVSEHSIVQRMTDNIYRLKNDMYWMDPTQPEVVAHSLNVIKDIVSRYDIDGLHYDDYFYPYPSYNDGEDFPDHENYQHYVTQGGELSKADWRRAAVDDFVQQIYVSVKAIKPHVKVGISPFGIWRPNYPESIRGFDQYEQLYADAKLWLNEGWLDYYTPQLYWNISKIPQSFPILLAWWESQNTQQRHLWPGMSSNKAATQAGQTEVINQIMVSRAIQKTSSGHVFWNVKTVADNPDFALLLANHVYNNQALVPASPWLDNEPPDPPTVSMTERDNALIVTWRGADEAAFRWVIYSYTASGWRYDIVPGHVDNYRFDDAKAIQQVAVIAVDRTGQQSARINLLTEHE